MSAVESSQVTPMARPGPAALSSAEVVLNPPAFASDKEAHAGQATVQPGAPGAAQNGIASNDREASAATPAAAEQHDEATPTGGMVGEHPNEAALVAAAAAMAAAQGHAHLATAAAQGDGITDPKAPGLLAPELNSYLVAAAATIQQQQDSQQQTAPHEGQMQDHGHVEEQPPAQAAVGDDAHSTGYGVYLGPEWEEQQARVREACRTYTDDRCPFPLDSSLRAAGGLKSFVDETTAQVGAAEAEARVRALPDSNVDIALGQTRCYWALLSASMTQSPNSTAELEDDLRFVYLDPVLQRHLCEQAGAMVGTSFFDYVHPEEKTQARADMRKIVESRTLFGSVTRCRYSRLPRIREALGAVNAPRDPEAHKYVEDEGFVAIDIVINWIGDGMALCFFHAIIDKGPEDNDENNKSGWSNWCGTPLGSFTLKECERMWQLVKASEREGTNLPGPNHVFQVLEAGESGQVLFSWPPPRLFAGKADDRLLELSQMTSFGDGSYFAHDFARYAQGVSVAPGSTQLSDANTSCTRRFKAKHQFATEGLLKIIESVLIPYGGIVLACFQIVYQGPMPEPDPEIVEHARASIEAARGQIRKNAEDDEAPNKRSRADGWPLAAEQSAAPHQDPAATTSKQQNNETTADSQRPQASAQPRSKAKGSGSRASKGGQGKPAAGSSLDSLANASLSQPAVNGNISLYSSSNGNGTSSSGGGAGASSRPAPPRKTDHSLYADVNPPVSGLGGANDPGGSVATLAAVAAAAAAQTKSCTGCGKSNSPEWRRGPSGHKTLCNACGLRYARSLSRRKKKNGKDGEVEYIEPTGDPNVVPKSRGGGGGSLPGVHRRSSKKRQAQEEARAAETAARIQATSASVEPDAQAVDVKGTDAGSAGAEGKQGGAAATNKPAEATQSTSTSSPTAAVAGAGAGSASSPTRAPAVPPRTDGNPSAEDSKTAAAVGAPDAKNPASPTPSASMTMPNGSHTSAGQPAPQPPHALPSSTPTAPSSTTTSTFTAPPPVTDEGGEVEEEEGSGRSLPAISVPVNGAESLNLAVSAAALQSLGAFDANAVSQVLLGQLSAFSRGAVSGSSSSGGGGGEAAAGESVGVPASVAQEGSGGSEPPPPTSGVGVLAEQEEEGGGGGRSASYPLLPTTTTAEGQEAQEEEISADVLRAAARAAIAHGAAQQQQQQEQQEEEQQPAPTADGDELMPPLPSSTVTTTGEEAAAAAAAVAP